MKSDLNNLMAQKGIDAFLVLGQVKNSHIMNYLLGGVDIGHTYVLKKSGDSPVAICNPMEREEAAKSGLAIETTNEYDYASIIKAKGDYHDAEVELLKQILLRHHVSGTVAIYGLMDAGKAYSLLSDLETAIPEITITGEKGTSIFDEAYMTKSEDEMASILETAKLTNKAFEETINYIKSHSLNNGKVVDNEGKGLTIGDVKAFAQGRMAFYGLEEEGGMIFAQGRDAGIPHSRGTETDIIEMGKTIVFDFFPYSKSNGYFHDMTRTFCIGHASSEVLQAYEQVFQAHQAVIDNLKVGEKASTYQGIVCDVFEEYGHPTPRTHPGTEEGYVHSVGHGLGLQIHSRPRFSSISDDIIQIGQVFTVEPGLYYPERDFGIRIEDTVYIDDDGEVHSLTTYPKFLVLEMEG